MKKLKTLLFAVALLSVGLLATPRVVEAHCDDTHRIQAGDLVKIGSKSTVYYIAENGKRYNFPNKEVFQSWYKNFSKVEVITAAELAKFPLGGTIVYRPGSRLVKFQSQPAIFLVSDANTLRQLATPKIATELYGKNWKSKVATYPASYQASFKLGPIVKTAMDLDYPPQTSASVRIPYKYLLGDGMQKPVVQPSLYPPLYVTRWK